MNALHFIDDLKLNPALVRLLQLQLLNSINEDPVSAF